MDDNIAFNRLFDRLDDLQKQIDEIFEKQSELQTKFDSHLLVTKELNQYKREQRQEWILDQKIQDDKQNNKFKRIIAVTSVIITTLSIMLAFVI